MVKPSVQKCMAYLKFEIIKLMFEVNISRNGMEWLTSFFSVNLTLEGLLLCKFKKFEWFLALSKADKMST